MANIKLGLAGSEVTLPQVTWISGPPTLPAAQTRNVKQETMSDGSVRTNILEKHPYVWTLEWDGILWTDIQTILSAFYNTVLSFINEYSDNAYHNVVITDWHYDLKGESMPKTDKRYIASLQLTEA
jgi:hypothetical protein